MLPLFPYDTAKVVTVCLHSKYLFTFYAKNRLFLIYINCSKGASTSQYTAPVCFVGSKLFSFFFPEELAHCSH